MTNTGLLKMVGTLKTGGSKESQELPFRLRSWLILVRSLFDLVILIETHNPWIIENMNIITIFSCSIRSY